MGIRDEESHRVSIGGKNSQASGRGQVLVRKPAHQSSLSAALATKCTSN